MGIGGELAVLRLRAGLKDLSDIGSDLVNGALDHTLILSDAIVDILVGQVAIDFSANLALLEFHLVLRERSSLVTEDEFNLSQLLD